MNIRPVITSDTDDLVAPWLLVFPEYGDPTRPQRDPRANVARKLGFGDGLFWLAELDGRIVGTIMAGYDGHRGWVYSQRRPVDVILQRHRRRCELMSRALRRLKRRGELSPRAPHLERQFMWHALSLGAHLEARGAGVGRALLAEAELALRSLGCPKVNLQVLSTNAGALAFWNSVGYAPDDVVSLGRRAARRRPTKP
ncbi:MAG: hypothetical protein A2V77_05570, partial [Anaeromyxobacter sp. RBG_16_69_14]